ncbi:uncharacterized protein PGTG_03632 [Puccinia graminis f. sp. tritici CRL 75-36-700-3]|uniref:Uncharacterized protein n=1 Tax=Puccinia graminis f. sp. tritici (strain CRL 75-36-700-3 / race SCCL) TaxID=418459 RepID=E3K051_PUCGT|nr:uncharacterized protein PGTG_03632 [Puccinia graminis f. sp. tritici CRL 75-36-700-3]EFP77676.1 hypothetical protein PGTG_03632 [Puccinia graminis f. sp. tritici CRL 75-36-700-3]
MPTTLNEVAKGTICPTKAQAFEKLMLCRPVT